VLRVVFRVEFLLECCLTICSSITSQQCLYPGMEGASQAEGSFVFSGVSLLKNDGTSLMELTDASGDVTFLLVCRLWLNTQSDFVSS